MKEWERFLYCDMNPGSAGRSSYAPNTAAICGRSWKVRAIRVSPAFDTVTSASMKTMTSPEAAATAALRLTAGPDGPATATTCAPCSAASRRQSSPAPSAAMISSLSGGRASSAWRHRASGRRPRWNGTMNEKRSGIACITRAGALPRFECLSRADQRRDERLRGRERTAADAERRRARLVQFVQILVGVIDGPDVMLVTEQVPHGQHPHHHRVVLVVVRMRAVAADGLQVGESRHVLADGAQRLLVVLVVDRIRLRHTHDARVADPLPLDQADRFQFGGGHLDELRVRERRDVIAGRAEVLEAQAGLRPIRHHVGAPVLEVLDAADLDGRIVNVDPVVREQLGAIDDHRHGDEV